MKALTTETNDKGGAAKKDSAVKTSRLELATALRHYQSNGNNELTVAQAIKAVFEESPGGKELFHVWAGTHSISTTWDTVTPDPQAVVTVLSAAEQSGYSRAAVQAMQEEEKTTSSSTFYVIDGVHSLEQIISPTCAVAHDLYSYNNGVWNQVEWNTYRQPALEVLPHNHKKNSMAEELLRTLEAKNQVKRCLFKSCYCFDGSDAVLVNCGNGILRVTGTSCALLPHDPKHYFTGQLLAKYDPDSSCNLFTATLFDALPDEKDADALGWWAGYMLFPSLKYKVCLICLGLSDTRKSTLVENGLGSVFTSAIKCSLSMSDICAENGYSLPSLQYAAVNIGGELNASEVAESMAWKILVGGERMRVRSIRGKPYEMSDYTVKLIFLSNHMPRFKAGTDAEFNRTRFIRFGVVVKDKDDGLRWRMQEQERDGIFTQFMVPGLQRILRGEPVPEGSAASQAARQEFFLGNDPYKAFVTQCCDLYPNAVEPKDRLQGAFRAFARKYDLGDKIVESGLRVLRERLALKVCRRGGRQYQEYCIEGIKLKDGVEIEEATPRYRKLIEE